MSKKATKNMRAECGIFTEDATGPIIACSPTLMPESKISARLVCIKPKHANPYVGLELGFPLGPDQTANEEDDFGVIHHYNMHHLDVVPAPQYQIVVKFPRGKYDFSVERPDGNTIARFNVDKERCALARVALHPNASVTVEGYGMPFANRTDNEVERWQKFELFVSDTVANTSYKFSEARLPEPFSYPYGAIPSMKLDDFGHIYDRTQEKSEQYTAIYRFDDDKAQVAANVQSVVQDELWVHRAANEVVQHKLSAYFVPLDSHETRFYIIVPCREEFRLKWKNAWPRLVKNERLSVKIFPSLDAEKEITTWPCAIVDNPAQGEELKKHIATKFHLVFCSAPTNVAIDHFAERINRISMTLTTRCNKDKAQSDPTRIRRVFVIRGYKFSDEYAAFMHLLENPSASDAAVPERGPNLSKWKLPLSVAFWSLVLLQSRATRGLDPDDCEALHKMQGIVAQRPELADYISCARGQGSLPVPSLANQGKKDFDTAIVDLFNLVITNADILCTTPAQSVKDEVYADFKEAAKAIAIDEAANMHRADLACVWGNVMLPCFLGGDPHQLPPAVLTKADQVDDETGKVLNRHVADGRISALEFLLAAGIPAYRLHTQLRMAEGMFNSVASLIYKDVPLKYGDDCVITSPRFRSGRLLENFMRQRYPNLRAPPPNTLLPIFVHCEGSRVWKDDMTGYQVCPDQCEVALDLADAFVRHMEIDASTIIMLAPYNANVACIRKLRRSSKYSAIAAMPKATTIDGFQGGEGDIIIAVMGTAHPQFGPGFTADTQRLNVLLTRQKAGLVVIGDIYVGISEDGKAKGGNLVSVGALDKRTYSKGLVLKGFYADLWKLGRIAHMTVRYAT
ncbi:ATP-dependent helicase [Paramyrothecium foliicola]|nr:ATP-dependent helicase [Paramyrothecium foliicola]